LGVADVQTEVPWILQPCLTQSFWIRRLNPQLLGLVFKRGPKLLGLALDPDPLKLESDKFNIIINIENMIILL
jgi:hypothetical protein